MMLIGRTQIVKRANVHDILKVINSMNVVFKLFIIPNSLKRSNVKYKTLFYRNGTKHGVMRRYMVVLRQEGIV